MVQQGAATDFTHAKTPTPSIAPLTGTQLQAQHSKSLCDVVEAQRPKPFIFPSVLLLDGGPRPPLTGTRIPVGVRGGPMEYLCLTLLSSFLEFLQYACGPPSQCQHFTCGSFPGHQKTVHVL